MTHYAILDTNAGLLQWIGAAASEDEALSKLATEVNDPDLGFENLRVCKITQAEADQVLDWWEHGAPSNNCPECIS